LRAIEAKIGFFEIPNAPRLFEVVARSERYRPLVAVITLQFVSTFHEHFQDRGELAAANAFLLLIDVEQHAARRRGASPCRRLPG